MKPLRSDFGCRRLWMSELWVAQRFSAAIKLPPVLKMARLQPRRQAVMKTHAMGSLKLKPRQGRPIFLSRLLPRSTRPYPVFPCVTCVKDLPKEYISTNPDPSQYPSTSSAHNLRQGSPCFRTLTFSFQQRKPNPADRTRRSGDHRSPCAASPIPARGMRQRYTSWHHGG